MARMFRMLVLSLFVVLPLTVARPSAAAAQQKDTLTYADLMQFRQIEDLSVEPAGRWLAFTAVPDRGDPEVVVHEVDGDARFTIALASDPEVADGGAWVAARTTPSLEARETLDEDERPRPGLALLDTSDGSVTTFDEVGSFALAPGGRWLVRHHLEPREGEDPSGAGAAEAGEAAGGAPGAAGARPDEDSDEPTGPEPGTLLVLRELASGEETRIEHVTAFSIDDEGRKLAYVVSDPGADGPDRDGLYVRALDGDGGAETVVAADPNRVAPSLAWSDDGTALAYTTALTDDEGEPGDATLALWTDGEVRTLAAPDDLPDGWTLPADNGLSFSDDGERLFVGLRPAGDADSGEEEAAAMQAGEDDPEADEPFEPYDLDAIVDDRELALWHWEDPQIQPQQRVQWRSRQNARYDAVVHLDGGRLVRLEDEAFELRGRPDNPHRALAGVSAPYEVSYTWDTWYFDAWTVDLETGERTPVAERLSGNLTLSPEGRFVAWYDQGHWYLHDVESGSTRAVTEGLDVSFAQEDWDYPEAPSSYGMAGWTDDDGALIVYDRYDVWRIPTDGGTPVDLTEGEGRATRRTFRVVRTDADADALPDDGSLLLSSFDHDTKIGGFFRGHTRRPGVEMLLEEEKVFDFEVKAEEADRLFYTREDFDEFPDVWVADLDFDDRRRLTDVNPQIDDFRWGTERLISFNTADGHPLQGAVFLPEDYDPDQRYPVLVYYYRFMSQRVHEFNEPVVNHRPSFPMYTSNGYVVFLPDIRFEVGRPGFAATKSLVPAVQKLVDLGIADPDAIGLHGHSWSGYQTAFVVTQTNIFAAAVTGAPVSNMTSAYSGIRWGSGLARQFQYERSQSRIGASLWEARDEYIENSPVFFADRIETPLLIQHGDDDGAVPWYQSIEMYLAMRRLQKPAVFLQYEGEPHHLQKYPNKLDYSIKMMEFFDHFLKGEPAPGWWTEGAPYEGG